MSAELSMGEEEGVGPYLLGFTAEEKPRFQDRIKRRTQTIQENMRYVNCRHTKV